MNAAAKWILSGAMACLSAFAAAPSMTIDVKHGSEPELKTRNQLEMLLKRYDLSRYLFTRQVMIDEDAIPHSHPVLTLHARHLGQDDLLLSTFVHEQFHWFLDAHEADTAAAEAELRALYKKVPVGFPEGARDEQSTYQHLLVTYLEYQAMKRLTGDQRALDAMTFWSKDHYTWDYRTLLQDEAKIGGIAAHHHLVID
jgi:hypothetical protein